VEKFGESGWLFWLETGRRSSGGAVPVLVKSAGGIEGLLRGRYVRSTVLVPVLYGAVP